MSKKYLIQGNTKLDFKMEDASDEITVYLYSRVYSWLAEDFAMLHARAVGNGIKKIHLRINSAGGDVFAGNAIYNLMKSSPIEVITYNDGMAASMGGMIFLCGNKRKMAKSAMFMRHNPSGGCHGEAGDMRKCADLLDKIAGVMADEYRSITGEDIETVKASMAKTEWYTSEEALKLGLVDEIYNSEVVPLKEPKAEMNAHDAFLHFAAHLSPDTDIPKTNFKQKEIDMTTSQLAISLGLAHDATEAEVQAALGQLKAKASTSEDLLAKLDKQKQVQAKALIDGAISDRKITEAQRQLYMGNAMNDYETTAQMLGAMSQALKPTDIIAKTKGAPVATGDKKFTDLSKDEIEALRTEDWEAYSKLFEAHYKFKPSKTKLVDLSA